ncbi:hypothetical protein ebA6451 [Aromatoleum aromaticum EbN1]|uniref:Uncharacterized protein n=1 Tax=Aromatoleum aromaticum (strain DSM 19018 / LMG 30748 / EbN1) TaxID=76114 RepID=Q5NYQ0_AROAE|nr:hypothetical protein ebA6451 [Aromatoleum aromaticum EbN1]
MVDAQFGLAWKVTPLRHGIRCARGQIASRGAASYQSGIPRPAGGHHRPAKDLALSLQKSRRCADAADSW